MIKPSMNILLISLLLLSISSCQKVLVPKYQNMNYLTTDQLQQPNDNNSVFPDFRLEPPFDLIKQFRTSSVPQQKLLINGDLLFVTTKDGKLETYSLTRLKKIGRYKLPAGIHANVQSVVRNLLVSLEFSKRSLFLLDPTRNRTLWTAELGSIITQPKITTTKIVVAAQFQGVNCLDLRTGKLLWQQKIHSQLHASPVIVDSLVIQGCEDGKLLAINLTDGLERWQISLGDAILSSPIYYSERLICATREGIVTALSLRGEILWQYRCGGMIRRTPAAERDKVVIADQNGVVYALELVTGKLVWQYESNTVIGTAPVLTNGFVFVGTLDNRLIALRLDTGKPFWQIELFGRVRTDPLPWRDYLIVASENNYLYVFGKKRK